jgi:Spy/CpxP family protein refolding chaperone
MKFITLLIRVAAVCAAVLLVSVPVAGQGMKWWHDEEFKKELVLTREQTARIEEFFQKAMPSLKVLKGKLDEAESQLQRMMEKADPSAMEQINVVEAARFELNKARGQMLWNMRGVLTQNQYVKLTALQQQAQKQNAGAKPAPTEKPR